MPESSQDTAAQSPTGVSVIIPTCRRPGQLRRALSSLTSQAPFSGVEIIVSEDGHLEETPGLVQEAVASGLSVRLVRSEEQCGVSAARNRALGVATGHYIVFTDDDCLFPPGWPESLLRPLRQRSADVAGGPDIAPSSGPLPQRCINHLFSSLFGTGGLRQGGRVKVGPYLPKGCNMALTRKVIERVGLFDENLGPGEEVELGHRASLAGFIIAYVPDAPVIHDRRLTLPGLLRKTFTIGLFRTVLARMHPGLVQPGHMIPFLTLFGLILLSIVNMFWSQGTPLLLAGLSAYVLFLLAGGLNALLELRDLRALILVPPLLCAHHAAHGLGYGWGMICWLLGRPVQAGHQCCNRCPGK